MKNNKGIIRVLAQHIDRGIERYEGVKDKHLNQLIEKAHFDYTVYRFNDGRILLVLPHNTCAFLYPSKEALFGALDLSEQ